MAFAIHTWNGPILKPYGSKEFFSIVAFCVAIEAGIMIGSLQHRWYCIRAV
jgi:hypothetical protein